jgi:hypothetical protein
MEIHITSLGNEISESGEGPGPELPMILFDTLRLQCQQELAGCVP